jgi:nuclear transport factor 2 (NTF2) superfamily protein
MASTLGTQEKDLQGKEQKKVLVVYTEHKFWNEKTSVSQGRLNKPLL